MSDIVKGLRGELLTCKCAAYSSSECCCDTVWPESLCGKAADTIEALRAENAKLHQAMHDIYEVYAGSEGFKPETCPEAYLQDRVKEMAYIAGKHKRRRWWR